MNNNTIHILLADDDEDDKLLFKEALDELSFSTQLSTVKNGQALMQLLTEKKEEFPDILFLDLVMPKKNGSDCLVEIKESEEMKKLPVIIYSVSGFEEYANFLCQKGAHFYLRKSNFDALKRALHYILALLTENKLTSPTKENFLLNV